MMSTLRNFKAFTRIITGAGILLLFILDAFIALPLYAGITGSQIIAQVGAQRTRVETIAKDVIVLAYRPDSDKPLVINQLQNVLPMWQRVQDALQNGGDKSIGIPRRLPDDVALVISGATLDYRAISTAAQLILDNQEKPVDLLQVDIILQHETDYLRAMNQVVFLFQQHIDSAYANLFWIELGVSSGLLIIALVFLVLMERTYKQIAQADIVAVHLTKTEDAPSVAIPSPSQTEQESEEKK